MPSTFFSLLIFALSLERVTGAPSYSYANSSSSLAFRDQVNAPQWVADYCSNAPGCKMENGLPIISDIRSTSKNKSLLAAAPNVTSTVLGSDVDGQSDDIYSIQLDDQHVGTGLCSPDRFLEILIQRSECPMGSTMDQCSGSAEYECGYTDATVGSLAVLADIDQKDSPKVDKCTMLFSAFSWANDGATGEAPNSKYSDIMKGYAIEILKASMASPHGNTTRPLMKQYYFNIAEMKAVGDKVTFMVPQRMTIAGIQRVPKGEDPRGNSWFAGITVNINCPPPAQKMDCSIWPTLLSSLLGAIPGIGAVASAGFSLANQAICP